MLSFVISIYIALADCAHGGLMSTQTGNEALLQYYQLC